MTPPFCFSGCPFVGPSSGWFRRWFAYHRAEFEALWSSRPRFVPATAFHRLSPSSVGRLAGKWSDVAIQLHYRCGPIKHRNPRGKLHPELKISGSAKHKHSPTKNFNLRMPHCVLREIGVETGGLNVSFGVDLDWSFSSSSNDHGVYHVHLRLPRKQRLPIARVAQIGYLVH